MKENMGVNILVFLSQGEKTFEEISELMPFDKQRIYMCIQHLYSAALIDMSGDNYVLSFDPKQYF